MGISPLAKEEEMKSFELTLAIIPKWELCPYEFDFINGDGVHAKGTGLAFGWLRIYWCIEKESSDEALRQDDSRHDSVVGGRTGQERKIPEHQLGDSSGVCRDRFTGNRNHEEK